ncbi:conserved hypothetical protein [Methanocaldococcus vulcanius M7]|uniref:DUF2067 domain-containing protein n=1 Tax=Methanocaldococcus vulcanius (strain ATCC 700851 / DSM 12094 / M7) TaxID=579137 RepID=C9RID2_METVM|nr:DUF2067 family protein [Methanocaldococcus vulcanius]ACX73334.1 conserved hypothetical protein [Methanocaldococcus vulcanius M7]
MKKTISSKVSCDEELLELCETISKMELDCTVESKGDRVRVHVFGYDKDVLKDNYRTVREVMEKIKRKYQKDEEGLYKYRLFELKYPVNKQLVMETLKTLGYKVLYEEEENAIRTDIDINKFNEILKELQELSQELRFSRLGSKPVKNLVILSSYITKKPVDMIIEEALEKGIFREEEGKIVLNKDINLAKKELLEG